MYATSLFTNFNRIVRKRDLKKEEKQQAHELSKRLPLDEAECSPQSGKEKTHGYAYGNEFFRVMNKIHK